MDEENRDPKGAPNEQQEQNGLNRTSGKEMRNAHKKTTAANITAQNAAATSVHTAELNSPECVLRQVSSFLLATKHGNVRNHDHNSLLYVSLSSILSEFILHFNF